MPVKGYKTLTITEDVHAEIEIEAKKRFMTPPKFVEYMLANCKEHKL